MKKINIQTSINVFESPEELSKVEQNLLKQAHEALNDAYAPYSNFRVGAAVLLANGTIAKGSNMENAAYPMCLCAERAAIAAASSKSPNIPITAIAITVKHAQKTITEPAAPCGSCRQVLFEVENRYDQAIKIILRGQTGPVYAFASAKDLLPLSFSNSYLT